MLYYNVFKHIKFNKRDSIYKTFSLNVGIMYKYLVHFDKSFLKYIVKNLKKKYRHVS